MQYDQKICGFVAVLTSVTALSTTGVLIRYLTEYHNLSPFILAFWRNLFLVLILGFILEVFYPRLMEIKWHQLPRFARYGLVLFLFNLLWTYSVQLNGAGVATVLVCLSSVFTLILGRLFLQEPLTFIKIGVCFVSLVGTIFITDMGFASFRHLLPILCGAGAGLCYSVYNLTGRTLVLKGVNPWTALFYGFSFAGLCFFCVIWLGKICFAGSEVFNFFQLGGAMKGWGCIFLLAVGPTLVGFGLMNVSLACLSSSTVNIMLTAEPPLTIIWAYLLLNESLGQNQIIGSILILGAIIWLALSEFFHDRELSCRVPQPVSLRRN